MAKFKNPLHLLLIATVGNTLGSLINYFIGKFLSERMKSETIEKIMRKKALINKYGPATGLLCWLPIVGDLYATALGFFKLPLLVTTFFILIGKFLRYLIILLPFM
ncbi:MAG: DedA family protein [Oligoflexia bacterium]|nr:DedA family protein [Oligoflexia bacterium]